MKMMQRRDNPLFQRRNILFFALILVSVFSLIFTSTRSMLTRVVYSVVPGIFSFGSAVSSTGDSFLTNFRNKQALVYENAVLRIENSRMEAQVLDRNLLEERVIKLEESLGRVRNDDRVVAQVIAPFGQSLYDTLLIDVGTEHGIKNGDFVVYAGAGVIGKIVEATGSASKVKLFSSSGDSRYTSLVLDASIAPRVSISCSGAYRCSFYSSSSLGCYVRTSCTLDFSISWPHSLLCTSYSGLLRASQVVEASMATTSMEPSTSSGTPRCPQPALRSVGKARTIHRIVI